MRTILWLAVLLMASLPPCHAAEKRFALVVGIQNYEKLPTLNNAVADTKLIATSLKDDNFEVESEQNVPLARFQALVTGFAKKLRHARKSGDKVVALFYYAGHGIQDDHQTNYLFGRDADLTSKLSLASQGLSLTQILDQIRDAKPNVVFAVIDACRDNPLPADVTRSIKIVPRGLAEERGRRGMLIAFSTDPGKVALDGDPGRNSPFALALAHQLSVPGQEATQMFSHVNQEVLLSTGDKQLPWYSPGLIEDFHFRPGRPGATGIETTARTFLDYVDGSARIDSAKLDITPMRLPFRRGDRIEMRISSKGQQDLYCWVIAPDKTAYVALPIGKKLPVGAGGRGTWFYPRDYSTDDIVADMPFENLFDCFGVEGRLPADLERIWRGAAPSPTTDAKLLSADEVPKILEKMRALPKAAEATARVIVR